MVNKRSCQPNFQIHLNSWRQIKDLKVPTDNEIIVLYIVHRAFKLKIDSDFFRFIPFSSRYTILDGAKIMEASYILTAHDDLLDSFAGTSTEKFSKTTSMDSSSTSFYSCNSSNG